MRYSYSVIQVSLTALITIYLLLFLAGFSSWILGEWNRLGAKVGPCAIRLRCVICAFEFEDRTDALLRGVALRQPDERFKLERI